MRAAIAKAREGIEAGQTPFGACIARDGRMIACEHNQVWRDTDITAHAEIRAIREACRAMGTIDLSGCTMYSTCEPCPMCFAACHWAKLSRVVYAASIADAQAAGFTELTISNEEMKHRGGSPIAITGGVLAAEAVDLFAAWRRQPGARAY